VPAGMSSTVLSTCQSTAKVIALSIFMLVSGNWSAALLAPAAHTFCSGHVFCARQRSCALQSAPEGPSEIAVNLERSRLFTPAQVARGGEVSKRHLDYTYLEHSV
jgi:hypothetical protein